jgi:hypothetical protein
MLRTQATFRGTRCISVLMEYKIGWVSRFGLDVLEKRNIFEPSRGTKPQLCARSVRSWFTTPTETSRFRKYTSASAGYGISTAIDEEWLYGLLEPDNGFVAGVSEERDAFMFREIWVVINRSLMTSLTKELYSSPNIVQGNLSRH